jgi:hypothetical protein
MSAITSKGTYLGTNSRENPYSQQEEHEKEKLANKPCLNLKYNSHGQSKL